jgi:glyoxylase-like metal-dependent hydrolase (beta-lactamase superfamily II)
LKIFIISLFIASFSFCQKKYPLEIQKLSEIAYVFVTYQEIGEEVFPANGMFLLADQGAILIDTPWDVNHFQTILDTIFKVHGKRVIASISTHYHDDRTGAIDFLKENGIKTYSTLQTKKLCIEKNEKIPEFHFKNDTVFKFGDIKIETFYPGKGHTEDNIVVWIKSEKILFAGCLVKSLENDNIGNIRDADLDEWTKSVAKVKKKFKSAKIVIPGHYLSSDVGNLDHTINLINRYIKEY